MSPSADGTVSAGLRPGGGTRGHAGCPKHMVYGPCGGVRELDLCEVDDHPCPFVAGPVVTWREAPTPLRPAPWPATDQDRAVILTDLRVRPFDLASITSVT